MSNVCPDCGFGHEGLCEESDVVKVEIPMYPISYNDGVSKSLRRKQIIDLLNMPDHVVFASDALQITNLDVPLYLPNGAIGGKARVVEGDDEDAILIEIESSNPMVAQLFKGDIVGISLVQRESTVQDTFIEEVKLD